MRPFSLFIGSCCGNWTMCNKASAISACCLVLILHTTLFFHFIFASLLMFITLGCVHVWSICCDLCVHVWWMLSLLCDLGCGRSACLLSPSGDHSVLLQCQSLILWKHKKSSRHCQHVMIERTLAVWFSMWAVNLWKNYNIFPENKTRN